MGEGEAKGDAKDVTDEMEESGQIEGLQDEVCEPPTGDAGQNDKPIDVDEVLSEFCHSFLVLKSIKNEEMKLNSLVIVLWGTS